MKRWIAVAAAGLLVVGAVAPGIAAAPRKATPPAASFDVQGTVATASKGWFDLSVDRVFRGQLARGAKIRVTEVRSTRYLKGGKPATATEIKSGARVRVVGTIRGSGKQVTYAATTVTVLQ
jgi:hypothetical protein